MKIAVRQFFAFAVAALFLANPVFAQSATLSLSPASGTFNKSCAFALQVNLNTNNVQTDGTDAIVLYDQSKLTATSISSGSIYADYPGNNIDDNAGKVTISGLASVSSAFSGQGTLATINFMVKDTAVVGATIIKFDFDAKETGKTTDSNVVERGTVVDILGTVVNGNYTIGSGTCAAVSPTPAPVGTGPSSGAPGATPSGAITPPTLPPPPPQLPPAGTQTLTYTLAIVGSVLTILGILGLSLL